MKKSARKSPPKHLSAEARTWWRSLAASYSIEDEAGLLLLQTAGETFDRMRQCQQRIREDGDMLPDRFGQMKPHPLLSAERDARGQMLQAIKQLGFDVVAARDLPGRPAQGFGWKG